MNMNKTEQEIIAGVLEDLDNGDTKGQVLDNILLYIMNKRDIDKFSHNGKKKKKTSPEKVLITVTRTL